MNPDISIIHTTHSRLPKKLKDMVINQLLYVKPDNAELIIVSEDPETRGDQNITYGHAQPGLVTLYEMVMEGLQNANSSCVYPHAEADCLYPSEFFQPFEGLIGYNMNKWRMNTEGAFPDYRWASFSGCVGDRNFLRSEIFSKLHTLESGRKVKWCEPCNRKGEYTYIWNQNPYIDVRWGGNLTGNREGDYQEEIPYWGKISDLQNKVGLK